MLPIHGDRTTPEEQHLNQLTPIPPADDAPDQPYKMHNEAPEGPPPERFPSIVLAGPGCLALMFVLVGTGKSGIGLLVPALAALAASVFFGIIAARSRGDTARPVFVLLAFAGPVLFCLSLMGRL